jgi:enamine deaminase RidA (YjgF/YER057c/UK114 family)
MACWCAAAPKRIIIAPNHGQCEATAVVGLSKKMINLHAIMNKHMTRTLISSGSSFEEQIGYSRAVVAGDWIFVSGTTGFDYSTMSISDDLLAQTEQCLKNIESALQQANASLQDVVRVTYVLPDGAQFEQCWPVLRKYFGAVRPAAMMMCAGLADPRMKIEIEVTALRQLAA